jgi:isoleucyl-tRNA synthetase
LSIPDVDESAINTEIERAVSTMQTVVELGRQAREKAKITFRIPIPDVTIVNDDSVVLDDCRKLEEYIKSELNTRKLTVESKAADYVNLKLVPDRRALGKRLGKTINPVLKFINSMTAEQVKKFQADGKVDVDVDGKTITVSAEEVSIAREFTGDTKTLEAQSSGSTLLIMSKKIDKDCKREGLAREAMSVVQQLRKKGGLNAEDEVQAWYTLDGAVAEMEAVLTGKADFIKNGIRVSLLPYCDEAKSKKQIINETIELEGAKVTIFLTM